MCSFALLGGGVQKTSQYLVWPSLASHLLRIELIRLLIVACGMLVHSSSMAVQNWRILTGTGIWCCIRIVYMSYPEHPKHAQCVTYLVSMLAMQELATIKGHCFLTQHNATDVECFEGTCNLHADCRNVRQNCCPWTECSFYYHKPSPKAFQTIWQHIQLAWQQQIMCNHTSPGSPHPACSPPSVHQDRLRPAIRTATAIGLHN